MSPQNLQAALLIGLAVLFLAVAIWMFLRANRKTTIIDDGSAAKDVLEDGAAPAARNQALIDAPSGVAKDVGQTSANANSDMIAAAGARADAEAGVSVAPTVGDPVPPPLAPKEEPKQDPKPEPAAAAPEQADDLRKIKGVGPKLVGLLKEQGITSFAQIAAWDDADVERVDATLGRFAGRITRDQWVEQAKLLAQGDQTAFSAKFGNDS